MRRTTCVFATAVILAWAATAAAQSATILGIAPFSPGASSTEQSLSITGGGFRPGLTVSLTSPTGGSVTVSGANILSVTGSSVQARVTLAVAGAWRVRVTNPGSKASNDWRFTVRPGAAVSPPSASPGGGTYTAAQKVTLTCATSGATIRYTTNGSEPSSSSAVYGAPISLSSTTTIKAQAFKAGMSDSPVTTAVYTFVLPQVAPPVARPAGGIYATAQSVTLATTTTGATIRYTTNGSEPRSSSSVYGAPLPVSVSTTLKARAFKSGMTDSAVTTASYAIILTPVAAPVAKPGSGCYLSPPTVTLSTATNGATIRYTTDGSGPSNRSPVYSTPIRLTNDATIKARAFKPGMADSAVITASYTVAQPVAAPVMNPPGGTFQSAQRVAITTATSGATIRYTTNGNDPSSKSTAYSGPLTVTKTATLKARAFKNGMRDSAVTTGSYTIVTPTDVADRIGKTYKIKIGAPSDWTVDELLRFEKVLGRLPASFLGNLWLTKVSMKPGKPGSCPNPDGTCTAGGWNDGPITLNRCCLGLFGTSELEKTFVHELTHAHQFHSCNGNCGRTEVYGSDLMRNFTKAFAWTYDATSQEWKYNGSKSAVARDYGLTNPLEDMTTSAELYYSDPERLKKMSPERYDFIRNSVFGGNAL